MVRCHSADEPTEDEGQDQHNKAEVHVLQRRAEPNTGSARLREWRMEMWITNMNRKQQRRSAPGALWTR